MSLSPRGNHDTANLGPTHTCEAPAPCPAAPTACGPQSKAPAAAATPQPGVCELALQCWGRGAPAPRVPRAPAPPGSLAPGTRGVPHPSPLARPPGPRQPGGGEGAAYTETPCKMDVRKASPAPSPRDALARPSTSDHLRAGEQGPRASPSPRRGTRTRRAASKPAHVNTGHALSSVPTGARTAAAGAGGGGSGSRGGRAGAGASSLLLAPAAAGTAARSSAGEEPATQTPSPTTDSGAATPRLR